MRSSFKSKAEQMLPSDGKNDTLRLAFFDEATQKDLLLFVKKRCEAGPMTIWVLEGICETKDYDESMEHDGRIRKWLDIEIEE